MSRRRPKKQEKEEAPTPAALIDFDSLPDSANVRLPVVRGLLACCAATVWRMVRRGALPQPRRLGSRFTAWNVGDLRKSLAGMAAQ